MYGNPRQPEWQQEEPNNRVRHERQQGERPADHQQNTPQEKGGHRSLLANIT